ncbi:YiaA/YiaB family inner membrane protein [Deinococcus cellulosilyticus]|uniref:YiaAB two helix domain-containing protein n=1 Tax=Deinococcus cellulosilyticus (strain DSM 18568 / NBRC 106333 / KACC 11606 / 5516J-15) TaxID=1223518 RepID=A0A511N4V7_DEIC1|nr:YiaA/YiaB family inner membrane protein [Deinococcus cellulosilyticus]GEM47508.1 hypothetical protein DC3_31430 [Deinococcus cellulosilyticus NBRC 106333 = KACC 11606]
MEHPTLRQDTGAWILQVWLSFLISIGLTLVGIVQLDADLWSKGYMFMGLFFTVGSSFTLAKTIRDQQEIQRMVNRFTDAKTEKIIAEYEMKRP